MESQNLVPGAIFNSMDEVRDAVALYFAMNEYGHIKPVNNRDRLKVICTEHKDCPFILLANRISNREKVRITRTVDEHSSIYSERRHKPTRVTARALRRQVETVMKETNGKASANDIRTVMENEHRISVEYMQVWRARERFLQKSNLLGQNSFMYIRNWLIKISESNPGTMTSFEVDSMSRFNRAAIIYGFANAAINWTLPVIALDACNLQKKDNGVLYMASLMTGDFDPIPVGIGITQNEENESDWKWFLNILKEAIPTIQSFSNMFVVCDGEKGIIPALNHTLPNLHHSYSSYHIKQSIMKQFQVDLSERVHDIAKTTIKEEAQRQIDSISREHEDVANYLHSIPASKWISAYFPVPRYGIVTTNSAESMAIWVENERIQTQFDVFVSITRKVMGKISSKYEEYSDKSDDTIAEWLTNDINNAINRSKGRRINHKKGKPFEVRRPNGEFRFVNIEEKTCSCGSWYEMQYPCVHALAVLGRERIHYMSYISPVFTYGYLKNIFKVGIIPIDTVTVQRDNTILPPPVSISESASTGKNKPIRLRFRSKLNPEDSPIICSRCHMRGHNARTCERRALYQPKSKRSNQNIPPYGDELIWNFN